MNKKLWNNGWTFYSDIDSTPKAVDLPHDAMRLERRIPNLKDGTQTGFYPGGFYTYEKDLEVSEADINNVTVLEFEGIYMKSSVYLNGERVGGRIYGYSDFFVDLTGRLKPGINHIRVEADNTQFANSRWYSGSGIYRDVWLHTSGKNRILPDGVRVTTVSTDPARVLVETDAEMDGEMEVLVRITKDGKTVAEGTGRSAELNIPEAKLWSAETPELYVAEVQLLDGKKVIDSDNAVFGIREIAWDAKRGLRINGKTVNLHGGCVHHDHGILGAAEYDAACLRRVRIMKEAGFNAVRISHNPASRAMLRACDELGMYVMNETFDTWTGLKSPYDYAMYFREESTHDLQAMIRVSFNHPSVILYSIGNEVHLKNTEVVVENTRRLVQVCRDMDPTRPVTNAINPLMAIMDGDKDPEAPRNDVVDPRAEGKASGLTGSQLANVLLTHMDAIMKVFGSEGAMKKKNAVMEPLDIVGYNYATYLYDKQHKDYPDRVLLGTESFPKRVYENWQMVKSMPWVTGDFLWTGWDYLGECGAGMVHYGKAGSFIQPYPTISAGCGNINLSGEITPQGYYAAVVYGEYTDPYLAVHPVEHHGEKVFTGRWSLTDAVHSWDGTGYEGNMTTVDVYSAGASVELLINGTSYGRQDVEKCIATFEVPYIAGELKAIQYDKAGHATGTDILRTPGKEKKIRITSDKEMLKSGRQDLAFLTIEITDENGIRKAKSTDQIEISVEGAATLEGFGNASTRQESVLPYVDDITSVFEGGALAVIRSGAEKGTVKINVTSLGTEPATIEIPVR